MIEIHPVRGLPALRPGDDLAGLLRGAAVLRDGDVLVVAQKAVSKVEGREVALAGVEPRPEAIEIAGADGDPRVVELVLRESRRIVRRRGSFLVAETRHGFVCASAGVDRSNTDGADRAILLPEDPDASAARLQAALRCYTRGQAPGVTRSLAALGVEVAVVISDSFGRPFRQGITGIAVGCAGLEPLVSHVGQPDDRGRPFEATVVHVADELAAAADLVIGPAGGVPAAVIRGYAWRPGSTGAAATVMPAERDLFR
jgi:coenzyme F420-0:L-glutamate ligase / coenzyme F420-1:gamma-L-glutamate ligase